MVEPASKTSGLVLLFIWLFGPEVGAKIGPSLVDGLITLGGAIAGTALAASRVSFRSDLHAIRYVLGWVAGACMLASFAGHVIESLTTFQAWRWPGGMAFLLTLFSDKWPDWVTFGARRKLGVPDSTPGANSASGGQGGAGGGA